MKKTTQAHIARIAHKVSGVAVALVLVCFSASAFANVDTRDVPEDAVITTAKLLKVHDGVVPSVDDLNDVSEDPALALMAVFDDDEIQDHLRRWALQALTQFEDERVEAFLLERLHEARDDRTFEMLLMAYAQTFGETAVDTVKNYLGSENEARRSVAVTALGMFGGQAGYDFLRELDTTSVPADVAEAAARYAH